MKNKNLKIQKIQTIENINQNSLNIPVGQIVLINVNKRESGVQQEPLEQAENELLLKKDADYLTKTKNTFTDKSEKSIKASNGSNSFSGGVSNGGSNGVSNGLSNGLSNGISNGHSNNASNGGKQQIYEKHQARYQPANGGNANNSKCSIDKRQASVDRIANDKPVNGTRSTKPNGYQTPKVSESRAGQQTATIVDQSNLIQHQQNVIQQLQQQNNYLQNITNLQQQHSNQPHNPTHNQSLNQPLNQPNRTPPRLDRPAQLKQSTISLNHHYEQPDMLLSKKAISTSVIRSNETGSQAALNQPSHNVSNREYDAVDGAISPRLPSTTNQSPHYEKPIINHNKPKPLIRTGASLTAGHGKQPIPVPKFNSQLLDDTEVNQIELFYRSQKTYVFVSRSMANLYFTHTDLINNGRYSSPRAHEWTLSRTGIPVLIFNKGGTKCRMKRQIRIGLAERGSGFQLFSDLIDNLSDYKKMHDSFHTFYLSIDHRKMAGLSFDCSASADDFLKQIELITSDPKNISLTGPKFNLYAKKSLMNSKSQLNKCKQSIKNTIKKYKKSDISMPCLFNHVTSLDLNDFERFYSLSTLVVRALNPAYQKPDGQPYGNDELSNNLSKLSIEHLDSNSENASNKQIYKRYVPSSVCSYSSSSSPISPSSSSSYTESDHS